LIAVKPGAAFRPVGAWLQVAQIRAVDELDLVSTLPRKVFSRTVEA
jgi:hypothetical protein